MEEECGCGAGGSSGECGGVLNPKVIRAPLRVRFLTQFPLTKPEMEV